MSWPGGARLGSLSGVSHPPTPGIFIPKQARCQESVGKAQGSVSFSGINGALISSDLICVALTETGAGSWRYREAQVGNHERGCGFPSPPFRARGSEEVRKEQLRRDSSSARGDNSVLVIHRMGASW